MPLTIIHLGLSKATGHIQENHFPLPTLSTILKGLAHELYSGRGFFVIRTLPVDSYSREDLVIVYAGKTHIVIAPQCSVKGDPFQVCLRMLALRVDGKMTLARSLRMSRT